MGLNSFQCFDVCDNHLGHNKLKCMSQKHMTSLFPKVQIVLPSTSTSITETCSSVYVWYDEYSLVENDLHWNTRFDYSHLHPLTAKVNWHDSYCNCKTSASTKSVSLTKCLQVYHCFNAGYPLWIYLMWQHCWSELSAVQHQCFRLEMYVCMCQRNHYQCEMATLPEWCRRQ